MDSFEKLEVLSRVRETPAGLRVDDAALDNAAMRWTLDELLRLQLIERRDRVYVLGPRGSEPAVTELLSLYAADRMVVVGELSSMALERIRSMASTAFANAFVLRKKRRDDDDG
jgi:hypothetical protein